MKEGKGMREGVADGGRGRGGVGGAPYALRRNGVGDGVEKELGRGGRDWGGALCALRSAIVDHSFPPVSSTPVIQVKESTSVCGGHVPAHPGSGTHSSIPDSLCLAPAL